MAIEQSHGKARTVLPRSSDLELVESAQSPTEGRAAGGRFAPGNNISTGNRWKAAVRKLLGRGAPDSDVDALARESWRIYLAVLRELPATGATVRTLAALQARHTVLAGHFTNRAADVGLETKEGAALDARAMAHGQRAERLAVTCSDLSSRLAKAKPPKNHILAMIEARATGATK